MRTCLRWILQSCLRYVDHIRSLPLSMVADRFRLVMIINIRASTTLLWTFSLGLFIAPNPVELAQGLHMYLLSFTYTFSSNIHTIR
jgi:hypothetical protein